MAGSFISIDVTGQTQIAQALNELLNKVDNLKPALNEIGDYLVQSTQERFIDQETPEGDDWKELSKLTLSFKSRKDRILRESGTLADSINYQIDNDQLLVGSNMEYAAMHQFGGVTSPWSMFPNKEIAARPFLGLSEEDEIEILEKLHHYLSID